MDRTSVVIVRAFLPVLRATHCARLPSNWTCFESNLQGLFSSNATHLLCFDFGGGTFQDAKVRVNRLRSLVAFAASIRHFHDRLCLWSLPASVFAYLGPEMGMLL